MFVTTETLQKLNACTEGIEWFAHHYPDGAELSEIMQRRHISPAFLHWGFLHLTSTPAEKALYYKLVGVEDSTNIFESDNIQHCDYVTNSSQVVNSKQVYYSNDIEESTDISHSSKVKQSHIVAYSTAVYDSTKVILSHNVKNSYNISLSDFVIQSDNIFKSNLITESRFILHSQNINRSMFTHKARDSKHCLFCYDIAEKDYCIFNHPVDQTQWEFIETELNDMLASKEMCLFDPWEPEDSNHTAKPHLNYLIVFQNVFSNVHFVNWIKALPYYDANLAYKLTLNPVFLEGDKN